MSWVDACRNGAVAAILAMSLSGCTAVGFTLGAITDSAVKDKSRTRVASVHRGAALTLYMRDGSSIPCHMLELREPDSASYAASYAQWRQSDPDSALLPRLGEHVKLSGGYHRFEGEFQGLAPSGVRIAQAGRTPAAMVRFEEFQTLVDESGRRSSSSSLLKFVRIGTLPTGTTVAFTRLQHAGGSKHPAAETVPWDHVVRVDGPAGRSGKVFGTIVGFVIDIVSLAAIAATGAGGGFAY